MSGYSTVLCFPFTRMLFVSFEITVSVGISHVFWTNTKNTYTQKLGQFLQPSLSSMYLCGDSFKVCIALLLLWWNISSVFLQKIKSIWITFPWLWLFPIFSIFQELPHNKICIAGIHKTFPSVQSARPISPWNEKALLKTSVVSQHTWSLFFFPFGKGIKDPVLYVPHLCRSESNYFHGTKILAPYGCNGRVHMWPSLFPILLRGRCSMRGNICWEK